jgi:hypothetical protein
MCAWIRTCRHGSKRRDQAIRPGSTPFCESTWRRTSRHRDPYSAATDIRACGEVAATRGFHSRRTRFPATSLGHAAGIHARCIQRMRTDNRNPSGGRKALVKGPVTAVHGKMTRHAMFQKSGAAIGIDLLKALEAAQSPCQPTRLSGTHKLIHERLHPGKHPFHLPASVYIVSAWTGPYSSRVGNVMTARGETEGR